MNRNDTTSRKWNASRPTYDEDWSDEEHSEPRPSIAQGNVRPPWETELGEDSHKLANSQYNAQQVQLAAELDSKLLTGGDEQTKQSIIHRPIYTLEDRSAEAVKVSEAVDGSLGGVGSRSIIVLGQILTSALPATSSLDERNQNSAHQQLGTPANIADRSYDDTRGITAMKDLVEQTEKVPTIGATFRSNSEVNGFTRNSASLSPGLADLVTLTTDETSQQEPLEVQPMFLDDKSCMDEENRASSVMSHVRRSSGEKVEEENHRTSIPLTLGDVHGSLKFQALSNAISESKRQSYPQFGELGSTEEDFATHSSKASTERTPSILLATNTWAAKNRSLKEQLEKNKRGREVAKVAPQVRTDSYDSGFIQFPSRTLADAQTLVRTRPSTPPLTNLNTLLEDEAEDELPNRTSAKRIPPEQIPSSRDSPNSHDHVSHRRSPIPQISPDLPSKSHTHIASSSFKTGVYPDMASSFNTHKALPPIESLTRTSQGNTSDDTGSSKSEDGSSRTDHALNADQEFALVQSMHQYQSIEIRPSTVEQDLPPILQMDQCPPTGGKQHNALPCLPSELPTATDGALSEAHATSWRPLNMNIQRDTVRVPEESEISRFSTSTTRSIDLQDHDEYTFEMRDAFNPAILGELGDTLIDERDDSRLPHESNTDCVILPLPRIALSASAATIQPPLKRVLSQDSAEEAVVGDVNPSESERLADELLLQLSRTSLDTSGLAESAPLDRATHVVASQVSTAAATDEATTDRSLSLPIIQVSRELQSESVPTRHDTPDSDRSEHLELHGEGDSPPPQPVKARLRSASSGSKFMEVMSPMTSMEQQRITTPTSYQGLALRSTSLLHYKDIKSLPTASERTQEYRRRTRELQTCSSGLSEYLAEMQEYLRLHGRDLPAPVAHVEYKASRSILPDKFVPSELSRTTARLGDRGKDAAKGLISKSTKGFKGLFHSNSRSVSGHSQKGNISSPLEVNGNNRTASMIREPGKQLPSPNSKRYSSSLFHPPSDLSTSHEDMSTSLQKLASPLSQDYIPSTPNPGHEHETLAPSSMSSQSVEITSTSTLQARELQPRKLPSRPLHVPNNSEYAEAISNIQSYFPKVNIRDIEQALSACGGDEQRAIGYLVVHGTR